MRNLRRAKGRRPAGRFAGIPHAVMDHACFITLSAKSVRLLLEFARQYNGYNNGDLCATWRLMHPRGWTSKQTLQRSIQELIDHDLLMVSRQGHTKKVTLYAVTWAPIDECRGKLDLAATVTPPGHWQHWLERNQLPDSRGKLPRQSGQNRSDNTVLKTNCPDDRVNKTGFARPIAPMVRDLNKLPSGEASSVVSVEDVRLDASTPGVHLSRNLPRALDHGHVLQRFEETM